MKKLIALVLALALVFAVAVASAATITINRHSSWNDENVDPESLNATYTWHRIFDVDLTDADHPVYTISGTDAADKVAALDSDVFEANLASDNKYYITLKDNVSDDTVFEALADLVANNADLFPGTSVTTNDDPVVLDVGAAGYFYITASNGRNVAVQTTGSAVIDEKNDYPTIDKKQKKENGTFADTALPAEIGETIYYQVEVTVPADANKAIKVFDTMSQGLTYNEDLAETNNVTFTALPDTDDDYDSNATFQIIFSADTVIAHRGETLVLTYSATVNSNALVESDRENEVTLSYDNGNYVLKDHVDYTTYFGGIEKVDGSNSSTKLSGVKFNVTVGGSAFNVQAVTKGGDGDDKDDVLYYIPGGSSNEVITGENGLIIIRGLDNTKTYTLTETETNAGYNLLETPTDLTLEEDDGTAYSTTNYPDIENNKGTVLPSTGGIGTTIFYILGGLLVVGAAVILVARRKASN